MIEIGNEFLAICGNLAFVNKLSWLLEDDYNNHGLHKSTEQETFHLILQILPKALTIEHVIGHQDDYRRYKDRPIDARLNLDADEIANFSSSIPLNHHIQSTKFVISGQVIQYLAEIEILVQQQPHSVGYPCR